MAVDCARYVVRKNPFAGDLRNDESTYAPHKTWLLAAAGGIL